MFYILTRMLELTELVLVTFLSLLHLKLIVLCGCPMVMNTCNYIFLHSRSDFGRNDIKYLMLQLNSLSCISSDGGTI